VRRDDKLYQQLFGHIPDDKLERIAYIVGKRINNEKFNNYVQSEAKNIKQIKWKKLNFVMWRVPRASSRPRTTSAGGFPRIYVPYAADNRNWFNEYAKENELPLIETPCRIHLKVFEKTPSAFSIKNKLLAELGVLRPWRRGGGDIDNILKSVLDMMQPSVLKDDALVIDSRVELFYAAKPFTEVEVQWMERLPEY
jgi:Holliday junction resolvase RusA-like endonuclease